MNVLNIIFFSALITLQFNSCDSSRNGCCYYKNELNNWSCLENSNEFFCEEIDNSNFLGGAECNIVFYCSEIDCINAGCKWDSNLSSGICMCN